MLSLSLSSLFPLYFSNEIGMFSFFFPAKRHTSVPFTAVAAPIAVAYSA